MKRIALTIAAAVFLLPGFIRAQDIDLKKPASQADKKALSSIDAALKKQQAKSQKDFDNPVPAEESTVNESVDNADTKDIFKLTVYPNPATSGEEIKIEWAWSKEADWGNQAPPDAATFIIDIFDVTGKLAARRDIAFTGNYAEPVSIGILPPGVYILRFTPTGILGDIVKEWQERWTKNRGKERELRQLDREFSKQHNFFKFDPVKLIVAP